MKNEPILLIEDHPDDEFLTLRILKKYGIHNVIVTHGADEALGYLFKYDNNAGQKRKVEPKLIILDLRLPRMDGFEFLETIRSNDQTRDIPVIVLSSSQQESDINRCSELGITAYLTKPLDIGEFIKAMHKVK